MRGAVARALPHALMFMLAILLMNLVCAWDCKPEINNKHYNFEGMNLVEQACYVGDDGKYVYKANVCGPCRASPECITANGVICAYDRTTAAFVGVVATTQQLSNAWYPLPSNPNHDGGAMNFTGTKWNGTDSTVRLMLDCSEAPVPDPDMLPESNFGTNHVSFAFIIPSQGACSTDPGPSKNKGGSSSLSAGWVVIIIAVSLSAFYVMVGCGLKYSRRESDGCAENNYYCVHYAFWAEFPNLVAEGCVVTAGCLRSCCTNLNGDGARDQFHRYVDETDDEEP